VPVLVPLQIPEPQVVIIDKLDVHLTGTSFEVGLLITPSTWLNHHMQLVQVWETMPVPIPDTLTDSIPVPLPDSIPVSLLGPTVWDII
jgi:hypothetical protein